MANLPTLPDLKTVELTKATTADGHAYEHGLLVKLSNTEPAPTQEQIAALSRDPQSARVWWEPTENTGIWIQTSPEVQKLGITFYQLFKDPVSGLYGLAYIYSAPELAKWYTFEDEAHHLYPSIVTYWGVYGVWYTSVKPTIIKVTREPFVV